MLDEFILEQLDKIEEEYQELNSALLQLNEEEKEVQKKIDSYLDSEDLGVELFSPRTNSGPIKEKIGEEQKHLEELHLSQMDITEQIALNREKEEKYQNFLNESRMKGIKGDQTEIEDLQVLSAPSSALSPALNMTEKVEENTTSNISEDHLQDLKEILNRIEKCINLVNHDRSKCKSELKNLRYYLKALISNNSNM